MVPATFYFFHRINTTYNITQVHYYHKSTTNTDTVSKKVIRSFAYYPYICLLWLSETNSLSEFSLSES